MSVVGKRDCVFLWLITSNLVRW